MKSRRVKKKKSGGYCAACKEPIDWIYSKKAYAHAHKHKNGWTWVKS